MTLAGFVGSDSFWSDFNRGWITEVLQKRACAPYLHMRYLISGNGPYTGWDRDRRYNLIWDANLYLQSLPKKAFSGIVCCIDETARDQIECEGYDIPKATCICSECCVAKAFSWSYDTHPENLETAHIFFDQGEPFMNPLRQRWLRESKNQRVIVTNLFWGSIVAIEALDSAQTPGLQAADFIAWAQSRRRSSANDRSMRHLADFQEMIIPSWYFLLDENILREKHARSQKINLG